jgi:hypothetical protein
VSKVLLITSLGCTPCTRVKRVLSELQSQIPNLTVEEMEFTSPGGSKLAVEHGILYPPAVFVNGTLIAKGKIDADKMTATIREMNGAHN